MENNTDSQDEIMTEFSVLMATYAKDRFLHLKESLVSLENQSVAPTEVIIVADGTIPPENLALIKAFSDSLPIKYIPLKKHIGLGVALRIGVEACQCSLIARFDTDDICEPDRFESQLHYMNLHPDIDICGSYALLIDENGTPKGTLTRPTDNASIKKIIWSCPVIHPSVMLRKEQILKVGSYKKLSCQRQEDFELWIRSAKYGLKFYNIPKCLIKYRRNEKLVMKTNTPMIGLSRFRHGHSAWYSFDGRLRSLLALCYPTVRPFLPLSLNKFLFRFDPRINYL